MKNDLKCRKFGFFRDSIYSLSTYSSARFELYIYKNVKKYNEYVDINNTYNLKGDHPL